MVQLVYSKTKTLTDSAVLWEPMKLVLDDCNIHVITNDAKYGNFAIVDAIIYAGDVAWFRHLNLNQLVVKNSTPGSNAVMTIVGTIRE